MSVYGKYDVSYWQEEIDEYIYRIYVREHAIYMALHWLASMFFYWGLYKEESMMKRKQTVLTMAVMAALLTPIFGGGIC